MASSLGYLFLLLLLSTSLICQKAGSYPHAQVGRACPSQGSNRHGLILQHRYGPNSILNDPEKPTHREIFLQDRSRVNWLRSRVMKSQLPQQVQEESTIAARLGNSLGTNNYIVSVGFGTPERQMSVEFDTGSDLTWIQCQPCTGRCYPQHDPIFNPSKSSSYSTIPCDSAECSQLGSGECSSSTCQYTIFYYDESKTIGLYARDTLTISPSHLLPNFLFGCGQDNNGTFARTAGILGLGRGIESFVTQSTNKYHGVFSYCLPSSEKTTGCLMFGVNKVPTGQSIQYTPLRTNPDGPTLYSVVLKGMSVNKTPLSIPQSTFTSVATIIDSGTVITRIPKAAHSTLTSAFRRAMSNYSPPRRVDEFHTCYDLSGKPAVPKIMLHFEGADMEVPESGVFIMVSESVGCLAFVANYEVDELTIIGNMVQRTYEVVYDIPNKRIGFASGGCA